MYIYKSFIVFFLLTFDVSLAFTYMSKNTNRINNNISSFNKRISVEKSNRIPQSDLNLNFRELSKPPSILPLFLLKHVPAFASPSVSLASSIGEPEYIIGDDVNIMKLLNLTLDNAVDNTLDDINYTNNNIVSTKIKANIDVIIDNIMKNCKKNGKSSPEVSIRNLQKYCSPTNIIKNKNTKALVFCLKKCKYSLLLGDFSNYETIDYTKYIDAATTNTYYHVDIKVFAPYKTMLRNGIQFNDMYYPKIRENNNICYVIYKLSFKDYEDGNLYIEGHTLVPPKTQI